MSELYHRGQLDGLYEAFGKAIDAGPDAVQTFTETLLSKAVTTIMFLYNERDQLLTDLEIARSELEHINGS